jgi:hypothetical protein
VINPGNKENLGTAMSKMMKNHGKKGISLDKSVLSKEI